MEMYFQKTQNLERVPPTADALLLHIERTIFQKGVWATSLQPQQNLPSPSDFGWKKLIHLTLGTTMDFSRGGQ